MTDPVPSPAVSEDVALLFVALAYGTDHEIADEEIQAIEPALATWLSEDRDAREVVMEAMVVFRETEGVREVESAIDRLTTILGARERAHVMEQIVLIAEADGIIISEEQSLIAMLAEKWDLRNEVQERLAQSTAQSVERPRWSLMHDLAVLYLGLAHSADEDLSEVEIASIITRFQTWQPDLEEDAVRTILRDVLEAYAEEDSDQLVQSAVQVVGELLPAGQRLAVLDDLAQVAKADGRVTSEEAKMITSLSGRWGLEIRFGERLDEE